MQSTHSYTSEAIRALTFVSLTCTALGTAATQTQASIVLDQQYAIAVAGGNADSFDPFTGRGQVFTVGVTGDLSSIGVMIFRHSSLSQPTQDAVLTLYDTNAGLPSAALGSASVPAAAVPMGTNNPGGFVSFDFSSLNIAVTTGQTLAFGLTGGSPDVTTPDTGSYFLAANLGASADYASGEGVDRFNGSFPAPSWTPWSSANGALATDYGFQTFVNIPGPSSIAAFVFCGAAFNRRRRTR